MNGNESYIKSINESENFLKRWWKGSIKETVVDKDGFYKDIGMEPQELRELEEEMVDEAEAIYRNSLKHKIFYIRDEKHFTSKIAHKSLHYLFYPYKKFKQYILSFKKFFKKEWRHFLPITVYIGSLVISIALTN